MSTLWDWMTWLKLGRPARGAIRVHPRGSFAFEAGAELARRLEEAFGDLTNLCCADLGCGPAESVIAAQTLQIPWRRLISVEAFPPYVERLRQKSVRAAHHEIHAVRIDEIFDLLGPRPVDVVLLIDVLEHFPRRAALRLLARLEGLARRGIVVFSPIGDVGQDELDGNDLQRHRSMWRPEDWARLGYAVEVYEGFHGQLTPPADAAWAIKQMRNADCGLRNTKSRIRNDS